jgi:hypothetical protein
MRGVLGDLVADEDVGELQPPAGLQDAVDLRKDRLLVGHEVDDPVGDHDVDRVGCEWELLLDQRLAQLDVGQPHRLGTRTSGFEHRAGHVDPDGSP